MKSRHLITVIMAFVAIISQTGCTSEPTDLTVNSIIPKPVFVEAAGGTYRLTWHSDIYVQDGSEEMIRLGNYLADRLNPATGLGMEVISSGAKPGRGDILLSLDDGGEELGDEGYELNISEKGLSVKANKPAGIFYGIQTIRQLLPAKIEEATAQEGSWGIATGTIRDYPLYSYRGAMRDVARHFFSMDDIKIFIDQMAAYKMNVLHLHLSDDQGWRIEIKSWPNLTEHGAKTEVGGGEGGFYTQEQYSDIVSYAQERYVTVIPELDMPGHTNAALASYPCLNVGGKATELYTGINVGFSTLDTRSDVTYKFVDDVIRELAALTPGPFIHIGGDESHSTKLNDYVYFVNRVQDIVTSHGKRILGWDEIAHATLKPNSVVQYWARAENAVRGVAQGAQVLMSPSKYAYIDMQYDSTSIYGLHWAGYIEVDHGYNWDPATLVPEIKKENIIGIEAPLWSETVSDRAEAEYLLFPRLPGYAEIGWTPAEMRSWDEYKVRLADHGERMKVMGIGFFPSGRVEWKQQD
ncbi:MAG: beta-N-acetylhexosaminidase [Bacteroidales bacterium]|nr:beta-N-acetylhexosaminidase [Bacteroidales bacterium]